jgi:hypothetical protein
MARQDISVSELVNMVSRGELQLPEMQRQYVWRATRVRDLLDSLYRGYPSGLILAWRSAEDVDTRDFAITTQTSDSTTKMLLLDGQQRLTSLSAVLNGQPVEVRGRKKPVDILVNLEYELAQQRAANGELEYESEEDDLDEDELDEDSDDEVDESDEEETPRSLDLEKRLFVVYSRALAGKRNWVPVSEIFKKENFDVLEEKGIDLGTETELAKAYIKVMDKVRKIKDYTYRIDVLEETMSYDEVTEIFVRVNSLGARLRGSDLALAQITARWRSSLRLFMDFQKEMDSSGLDIELSTIIRTLVAHATNQGKFDYVNSISQERLEESWEKTRKSLSFAVDFTKSELGITSSQLLSSPLILTSLAYWIHHRKYRVGEEEQSLMRRWGLLVNAKGRYGRGSSQEYLNQDLAVIRDGGGPTELLEKLRQQVGRLEIEASDFIARNARSGLFKNMFLVFASDGARDWDSQLPVSPNHMGKANRLQFHHIFPRKYLSTKRPELRKTEIDDIANLAFIAGATNQSISAKAPDEYLSEVIKSSGLKALENQCVPTDESLWKSERYEEFLAERRKLIAERMMKFIFAE